MKDRKSEDNQVVTKGFFKKELKKELRKYLTKAEFRKEFRARAKVVDKRLDNLEELIPMVINIENRVHWLEKNMYTKDDHAKFMEWMKNSMDEIRNMKVDNILNSDHISRLNDTSVDHENRICVLEG